MTRLILHLSHPARARCPRCTSRLPKAGFVVEDSAGVTLFICRAHLAELSQVCRLERAEIQQPSPDFDYFAFFPYGYRY